MRLLRPNLLPTEDLVPARQLYPRGRHQGEVARVWGKRRIFWPKLDSWAKFFGQNWIPGLDFWPKLDSWTGFFGQNCFPGPDFLAKIGFLDRIFWPKSDSWGRIFVKIGFMGPDFCQNWIHGAGILAKIGFMGPDFFVKIGFLDRIFLLKLDSWGLNFSKKGFQSDEKFEEGKYKI